MEMKERERNRKSLAVFLMLILGFAIGGVYAYWAGEVNAPEAHEDPTNITIGAGKDVKTVLDVTGDLNADGKTLVPENRTGSSVGGESSNVESLEKTFTVKWKEKDSDIISGSDEIKRTLKVTSSAKIVGANDSNNELVNVEIDSSSQEITTDGDDVTVNVKVTLTEPATKAVYEDIAGKPIEVTLTFKAE